MQVSLIALQASDVSSLSIIVSDLTAIKRTQAQLEQNNRKLAEANLALEQSNIELQQYASVASHDLQEPLRKIQMFSEFLKKALGDDVKDEAKKYMEKIIKSSTRMRLLITDMLNYSVLSASPINFKLIDLNKIIKDVLEDLEMSITDKGASVEVSDMSLLQANPGQMRQVFQNLVSNALKFTKATPDIKITSRNIRSRSFDAEEQNNGPFCLISVKDKGIGFDEQYMGRIFDLFGRLNSKEQYDGTGIGLSITKKIIEKHNGLISAKSRVGEGAEFLMILPLKQQS